MKPNKSTLLAWTLCGIAILGCLAGLITYIMAGQPSEGGDSLANNLTISLFLMISAIIGAIIISRHPRNTIGWLLMFYPVTTGLLSPLDTISRLKVPAGPLSTGAFLMAWIEGWSWWLLIGPIFLIPLLFPSGKLISRRWRWVIYLLAGCFILFLIMATFSPTIQINNVNYKNPLGVFPPGLTDAALYVFQPLLLAVFVLCISSIFIRYHRAVPEEKEQIKWLLYACGVFLIIYPLGFLNFNGAAWSTIFNITLIGIPLAIGAAILQYHLWDIDLIINRTLVYVPLTAILAGLYSASVALSQKFLIATTGQKSDTALVMTTFLLVAAFTPIKNGLQQVVDKRFKETASGMKEIHALDNQVRSVMEVLDGDLITQRLLATAVKAFQATGAAVYLDSGGQMRVRQATPGWREEDRNLAFPMMWKGRQVGLLCLGPRRGGTDYTQDERKALQQTVDRVAWAVLGPVRLVDEEV